MIIFLRQLAALSPLIIVGWTVVFTMLLIAWRRNHFLNATMSILGLGTAFFFLWFLVICKKDKIGDVTLLMHFDGCSMLYTSLVLLTSLSTCIFAYLWLKNYDGNKEEFYLLLLISTLGGILLTVANHLATLFIGVELISIPLFGLIGYAYRQRYSLEASIKYAILSAVASSFLLFGIAFLYAQTGNLNFLALGRSLSNNMMINEPLVLMSFGMLIIGLGFKLSLVPFHLWTPDVHQGAPAPVSIFLATTSKVAIFSTIIHLFYCIPIVSNKSVYVVLNVISSASIFFGNLMAINQSNIKRLLGYSSISHLGYLLVALIGIRNNSTIMPIEAIDIYWISYLISTLGVFGVVNLMSNLYHDADTDSLYFYLGLFWHHPILSVVMTAMMFSLAGIPITIGFIGKFYIFTVGIQSNLWWLIASVFIGSIISLYYYLRVIIRLYLKVPKKINYTVAAINWQQYSASNIVLLISTLTVIIFGVYPKPLINVIQQIINVK